MKNPLTATTLAIVLTASFAIPAFGNENTDFLQQGDITFVAEAVATVAVDQYDNEASCETLILMLDGTYLSFKDPTPPTPLNLDQSAAITFLAVAATQLINRPDCFPIP